MMNTGMLAAQRNLAARVKLTLPTGAEIDLDGGQVISFAIEEGADSPLLPGSVLSAKLTLNLRNDAGQWQWGGSIRGERPLIGSTARVSLVCAGQELPCGAFVISGASAGERSGSMALTGSDSILTELSGMFSDTLTYPAALGDVWNHLVSQTRYAWAGTIPNGAAIIDARPDWGEVTLRRAAGWIAQAAGGFVRVNRQGNLELASCQGGAAEALSPEHYMTLEDGFSAFGPVEAVEITPFRAEESFTLRDGNGAGETLSVRDNPLFIPGASHLAALGQGLLDQLKGLTLEKAAFAWRGDPAVTVGTRISLQDTHGNAHLCAITRQTLRFDQGFSAQAVCCVPEPEAGGMLRAITPEGGVNANALMGTVNGGLLAVGSVTARAIAARAITAEKLAAGSVSADHLSAGSVTADKLDAGTVSAKVAEFLAAEIEKLTAGEIEADRLYASFAHIINLAADSIRGGLIEADHLAAALAEVVSLHVGTGEFSFAQIENLLSNALILQQGQMDSAQIVNLAVTSANLLNATIGNLVIQGDDGKYYRIFIGSDGNVRTEEATLTDGEISAGQTSAGNQIVSSTANIGSLNATNIQASSAVIAAILTDSLTAGKITAGEALIASATIPTLYAASLKAIGDSIDLSANRLVRILVGGMDTVNRWFAFDNELGLVIRKPAWVDEDGVEHPASIWSTVTDETGYHIRRADLPGYVGSFARDRLIVGGAQIGDVVARKTSGGGWAWVDG